MEIDPQETYLLYWFSPQPSTPLQTPSSSSSPSPEKISFQFTRQAFKFIFDEPQDFLCRILEEAEYPSVEPLCICVDANEVDEDNCEFYISVYELLERIGIPGRGLHSLASSIVENVSEVKRWERSPNPSFKELLLKVSIIEVDVVMTPNQSTEIENAIRESTEEFEEANYGMVPASDKEKKRVLKSITVTGEENSLVKDSCYGRERKRRRSEPSCDGRERKRRRSEPVTVETCVICLEDIPAGIYATQVPCSHVFHSTCIKKWLEVSHFCPTCRFEFPVD